MKIQDLKPGMKFITTDNEKTIRHFTITKITKSRITVRNDKGYSHLVYVNRMTCHAFGLKDVSENLASGFWQF